MRFSSIIACLYILASISGSYSDANVYIRIFLLFIWLILIISENRYNFNKIINNKIVLGLIVHLLIYWALLLISTSLNVSIKMMIARLLVFSPILLFAHYKNNEKENKRVFTFSILIWSFYCIKASIFYYLYPRAARGLAADQTRYGDITLGGGYNLAYGSVLVSIVILDLLLSKRYNKDKMKKKTRFFLIILFAVTAYLSVSAASVITIIALISGVFVAIWMNAFDEKGRKRGRIVKGIGWILSVVLFFVLVFTAKPLGRYIIEITSSGSDVVSNRVYEIGLGLAGLDYEGTDLSYRVSSILSSLRLFFKNPIFGTGYLYGFDYRNSIEFGVGAHSELFDTLAIYGLISGLPILYCFWLNIININKYSMGMIKKSFVLAFFFMFIFNPFVSFQALFAYFYIVPFVYYNIKQNGAHMSAAQNKYE